MVSDIIICIMNWMSSSDILQGQVWYDNIPSDVVVQIMKRHSDQYSQLELENLCQVCQDKTAEWLKKRHGWISEREQQSLRVFDVLLVLAESMLLIQEDKIVCHYEKLLEWRRIAIQLDEAMFVSAYWAVEDLNRGVTRRYFGWDTVLGHNNQFVNWIMERGISENHFHLWASAPHFHISWVVLMNRTNQYRDKFMEMEERRQNLTEIYSAMYKEPELRIQHLQAVIIRLYLFAWLHKKRIYLDEYVLWKSKFHDGEELLDRIILPSVKNLLHDWEIKNTECMPEWKDCPEKENYSVGVWQLETIDRLLTKIKKSLKCCIKDIQNFRKVKNAWELLCHYFETRGCIELSLLEGLIPEHIMQGYWEEQTLETLQAWLSDSNMLETCATRIQSIINILGADGEEFMPDKEGGVDYISSVIKSDSTVLPGVVSWMSGENYFLYHMFRQIYSEKENNYLQCNLFWAYLVIKEKLRHELLQCNERRGLDNFIRYQDRKGYFIEEKVIEHKVAVMAIADTLCSQHIRHLEVRISPKESARANMEYIREIDTLMKREEYLLKRSLCDRYYFVLHFPKGPDKTPEDQWPYVCRHYYKRQEVNRKAIEIAKFREYYSNGAKRVLGVDSCSQEIGCRPEVFAQAFRYLKDHSDRDNWWGEKNNIPQLHVTYHVGEDFLDIADGLRAIEEAVRFLNLDYGDRIGHALALGLDIRSWYEQENYRIRISQQDYLDNLAWIYGKIVRMQLRDLDNLKNYVEHEFERYFRLIYTNHFDAIYMEGLLKEINKSSNSKGIYTHDRFYFNIDTYYNAWKLRGDNPECYRHGYFENQNRYDKSIAGYDVNSIYPKEFDIRLIPEVAFLYYSYHYNGSIKQEGRKMIEVQVPSVWVEGVQVLQRRIQYLLEKRGIAIETNPSSNVMIGLLKQYDNHPIVKWYNRHLVSDPQILNECPQLSVSINTDDQGIFNTSLENEYALMACALEQKKGIDGRPVYNRMMIYEWLDKIREFGNLQSFQKDK